MTVNRSGLELILRAGIRIIIHHHDAQRKFDITQLTRKYCHLETRMFY